MERLYTSSGSAIIIKNAQSENQFFAVNFELEFFCTIILLMLTLEV